MSNRFPAQQAEEHKRDVYPRRLYRLAPRPDPPTDRIVRTEGRTSNIPAFSGPFCSDSHKPEQTLPGCVVAADQTRISMRELASDVVGEAA